MAAPAPETVLARIVAAHGGMPGIDPELAPRAERAYGRALRHAAAPFSGLGLTLATVRFVGGTNLQQAIETLPEHGLCAVLEGAAGQRGLLGFGHGLVDALIEVQTTGKVEANALPPRPVTAIDEALSRDFLDLSLAALSREAAEFGGNDWPDRMQFGSLIGDRAQINLLLPDKPYHLFTAEVAFDGTDRTAFACLALPAGPGRTAVAPDARPPDPAWAAARARVLKDTPLTLEAVLMRQTLTLGAVERLKEGDLLPFAQADLQDLALGDCQGRVLLRGQLGQLGGKRAVRLVLPDPVPSSPPKPPSPQALPETPQLSTALPAAAAATDQTATG